MSMYYAEKIYICDIDIMLCYITWCIIYIILSSKLKIVLLIKQNDPCVGFFPSRGKVLYVSF